MIESDIYCDTCRVYITDTWDDYDVSFLVYALQNKERLCQAYELLINSTYEISHPARHVALSTLYRHRTHRLEVRTEIVK